MNNSAVKLSKNYFDAIEKNGYIVIDNIGNGSYGNVLKVKSKITKKEYALKLISYGTLSREKNAFREIECSKKFNHPNILQYYEHFFDNQQLNEQTKCFYQIMELCKTNLSLWLISDEGINRTDEMCVKMFNDIALGLKYIHEKGFIHRDLKSDNILISYDGKCKISDFGLSILHVQILGNESQFLTRGTLIYTSPEQLELKPYNFKADIFPLGCIFMQFYTELKTNYELFKAVNDLRRPQLPQNFFSKYGNINIFNKL